MTEFARFQGLDSFKLELISDFFEGLERVRGSVGTFLVQCSAHPLVHKITEGHWDEVFVVDTFIYPTKALAVLTRREVETPRSLGLVPATAGYVVASEWEEVVDVQSKPLVAAGLLAGEYDSGLTHLEHAALHPDRLRVDLEIGEVDTTWLVYGTDKRFAGELIGLKAPELYGAAPLR